MAENNTDQETLDRLASLGLTITSHRDPSAGWGYTRQGRDWAGPFTTPEAAMHAAFTEALHALAFRSAYSWVRFASPGDAWRYNGEAVGWTPVGWTPVSDQS